jgi:hypothetical protein
MKPVSVNVIRLIVSASKEIQVQNIVNAFEQNSFGMCNLMPHTLSARWTSMSLIKHSVTV